MNTKLDHEYLLEDVMEYDYITAEDHIIIHGMKYSSTDTRYDTDTDTR